MPNTQEHLKDCRWEKTTSAECEYRNTHYYCPHPEHECTCTKPTSIQEIAEEKERTIEAIVKILPFRKEGIERGSEFATPRDYRKEGFNDCLSEVIARLPQIIAEIEKRKTKEMEAKYNKAIYALGLMWNQYCSLRGHEFMSAGENAMLVLQNAGIKSNIQDTGGMIDYYELEKLLS